MKPRSVTLTSVSAFALLLAFTLAAPASSQLAQVKNAGDALVFYPVKEFKAFVLTVTGPCNFEYRTRTDGGEIAFRLPKDAMTGTYSFSLDATHPIDPKLMEVLHKARATGDNETVRELCREGRLPTGPFVQSGSFSVVERKIVLDTTPESRRRKRDEGEKATELSPAPGAATGDRFAADLSTGAPETRLAFADTSASAGIPGECVWARMKPGAGVAER